MDLYKYCEDRAMSGYKSALLFYDPSDASDMVNGQYLYHLLLPLESAPAVTGSVDTFDFDILTCSSKGQVEGKESIEQKDVDFLWHRDNVYRLEQLQGKVIEFMVVYQDFTARTFTGTIKVRPQDAGADVMRGTFTITPMSASATTIYDARDMIADTIVFTAAVPSSVTMKSNTYTMDLITDPVYDSTEATDDQVKFTVLTDVEGVNDNFAATFTGNKLTITYSGSADKEYGLVFFKVTKKGYASWTTSIAVEYNKV